MVISLSGKITREELKPGDHIYTWRKARLYAHHGIFVGGDVHEVIHFTSDEGHKIGSAGTFPNFLSSSFATRGTACPRCEQLALTRSGNNSSGVVKSSCLDCFLAGGSLYLFFYSVSRSMLLAKGRGGTCTRADSDPPDLVLHRARYLLTHGFGAYSLSKKNCEDFAVYCKTNLLVKRASSIVGGSGQVSHTTAAVLAIPFMIIGISSIIKLVHRYRYDIGNRKDAVKIPVEELESYLQA